MDFMAQATPAVPDTTQIFGDVIDKPTTRIVPGTQNERYIAFGDDDQLPYEIIQKVGEDEVTAQNKLFNVLTCYGQGIRLKPEQPNGSVPVEASHWAKRQNLPLYFLEQATDMKYFFFTVSVIILNRQGTRINKIRHKEACYCRFAEADSRGKIPYVYYANWKEGQRSQEVERIPLLDIHNPLEDLETRLGIDTDDGRKRKPTKERKFAILTRFPTPGAQYYPSPYWNAIFRGGSYDEKRLIAAAKRAKLRNHTSVKYQVEIEHGYWQKVITEENIIDPVKQVERIRQEKENINKFLFGAENSNKVWVSGFFVNPDGKEVHDVRINLIDAKKEGGDWNEDIQAAANTICYGDNIHPNMVGATPGKSQQNNSGSDKRELFTMKQALETAYHHIMLTPLQLVFDFNGWNIRPEVPMIQLTTLDKHVDAKEVTPKP